MLGFVGTYTRVGKFICHHCWVFGILGRGFEFRMVVWVHCAAFVLHFW